MFGLGLISLETQKSMRVFGDVYHLISLGGWKDVIHIYLAIKPILVTCPVLHNNNCKHDPLPTMCREEMLPEDSE
jgi:hypothetical protein